MRYIKLYENFEFNQTSNEYFDQVKNMLKINNMDPNSLIATDNGLSWGPYKIETRKDNEVYLIKGVVIKKIGRLKGGFNNVTNILDNDRPNPKEYPDKVDSLFIYDYIWSLHGDMEDTDIHDRVYKFNYFLLNKLNISDIDTDEFTIDDDTVNEYVKLLNENDNNYPPIVYDSEYNQIIDGTHRCQALIKKGIKTVWAYVGEDLDHLYTPTYGEEYSEEIKEYPSLKWVREKLRFNLVKPIKKKVLKAFIVGSEAKGTAKPDSDLDIAVVIENMPRKTSLQFTEEYQSSFVSDKWKPKWNGRIVDFQFFYFDDKELDKYSKIELK
jgi:predicted nucleotidyltransferase